MLCETWLRSDNTIDIPGYTCVTNSRGALHKNACVGSGGVAIMIKDILLRDFSIDCVDSNFEGILAVKLLHKHTDLVLVCICLYIPLSSHAMEEILACSLNILPSSCTNLKTVILH